jgi:hypothetical protein
MSVRSFDELATKVTPKIIFQDTCMRLSIPLPITLYFLTLPMKSSMPTLSIMHMLRGKIARVHVSIYNKALLNRICVLDAVAATLLSATDTERNGDAEAPHGMYTARFDYILITPYLRCRSGKKRTYAPGLIGPTRCIIMDLVVDILTEVN